MKSVRKKTGTKCKFKIPEHSEAIIVIKNGDLYERKEDLSKENEKGRPNRKILALYF